tara:strand:- start:2594 stop:3445 length:852 start_codon:yes stop_codon:yes gene_type:complete
MLYEDKSKNIHIEANDIRLGENVTLSNNIHIKTFGKFYLGDGSHLGSNVTMKGNDIVIGKHFYYSPLNTLGLNVGGGGSDSPNSNLTVGDRCVFHNGLINICEPVVIGNDVGLSNHVDIITHGFWYSMLEGYPTEFAGVTIGNNVIVGWRSTIMTGVEISDNVVIGNNSNVVKSITKSKSIYVGNPARFIKKIEEPNTKVKLKMLDSIVEDFKDLLEYYVVDSINFEIDYPNLTINNFTINVDNFSSFGVEDEITDMFRDFIRKRGIRIYTDRKFSSSLKRKK